MGNGARRGVRGQRPPRPFTDDFKMLSGDDTITVRYMFEHVDAHQIGDRHFKDA